MKPVTPQNLSEGKLLTRLLDQDPSALEYLYDHYAAALYGVITRIIPNENVAQETLQDTFMKIWQRIDTYDANKGRLFTWMLNITRNLAIDKVRSRDFKEQQKTDQVADNVYMLEQNRYAELSTEGIGIKELLTELNADQQLVVELLYFKGYTQSEVAKEYNIPLGTVKTRLRSALKILRTKIKID